MVRDEDWLQAFGVFLAETREMLVEVEPAFIFLEKESPDSADFKKQIDGIFRLFHSLKASTAAFELFKLRDMTHNAENLLDTFRKVPRKFSSEQIDLLCQTCDFLAKSLDYISKTFSDENLAEKAIEYNQKYIEELDKIGKAPGTGSDTSLSSPEASKTTSPTTPKKESVYSELRKTIECFSSSNLADTYSEFAETIPGEILDGFLLEAKSLIKKAKAVLSQISPENKDISPLKEANNAIHSFKGLTDFLNFSAFSQFCITLQTFIRKILTHKILLSVSTFSLLKTNFDDIEHLLTRLNNNPVLDNDRLNAMTEALTSLTSEAEEESAALLDVNDTAETIDKQKKSIEGFDILIDQLPETLHEMKMDVTPEISAKFREESEALFKLIDAGILKASTKNDQAGIIESFKAFREFGVLAGFLGYSKLLGISTLAESIIESAIKRPLVELISFFKTINATVNELRNSLERLKNGKDESFEPAFSDAKSLEIIFREFEQTEKAAAPSDAPSAKQTDKDKFGTPTIRVEETKIDKLMGILGELFTTRASFPLLVNKLQLHNQNSFAEELSISSNEISRLTEELRGVLLSIRMVTLKSTFQRIPRLVRDLSKMLNKEIRLDLIGEATEMDKNLVEKLTNPLVHIIRNAVDHGIEMPEDRLKKGKPAEGKIVVSAETEGSTILVKISDDGKGLDPEFLKRKAVSKKLISQQTADAMSHRDALNLIFLAGFSTAEKLTDVSGRGVGMDVVMNDVKSVQGSVQMDSSVDAGSTFTLKFPTSMIISDLILIKSARDEYLIPVENISELVKVSPANVHIFRGKMMTQIRDAVYPIIHLDDLLYATGKDSAINYQRRIEQMEEADFPATIIESGKTSFVIAVDRLVTQEKVMVKPLAEEISSLTKIFSGAAIMGDGRVVLVINPRELANHFCNFF
ncbi:MAG: chemotaxis protein CheW [Candidatus Riflebacteria bacterium]|nr:chemotaxis protein CheW [Candidatus Riflebacteria bacterium]